MTKFVYLLYGGAYEDCIINAVKEDNYSYYFKPFSNELIKKIFMIHNARPFNARSELPLKKIWFDRALEGMPLDKEDKIYFLLYESFHLSYSRNFLLYLKDRFPNCKICFMFLNPVTDLIANKVAKIADSLDAIITFNKKDAKQHHLLFAPLQPYKLPINNDDNISKSDVFFIGADKGRLPKLLSIYEKLTNAGLKCDFHIVGVPKEKQKYNDSIVYNQRITYAEVLNRVKATKCVLEVLQNGENYLSIRTVEALQYHRKLLTESKSIKECEFYNPKLIQVFDNPEQIDVGFIRREIDEESFTNINVGNVNVFKEFLKSNV